MEMFVLLGEKDFEDLVRFSTRSGEGVQSFIEAAVERLWDHERGMEEIESRPGFAEAARRLYNEVFDEEPTGPMTMTIRHQAEFLLSARDQQRVTFAPNETVAQKLAYLAARFDSTQEVALYSAVMEFVENERGKEASKANDPCLRGNILPLAYGSSRASH
jgi:hypothetical protein